MGRPCPSWSGPWRGSGRVQAAALTFIPSDGYVPGQQCGSTSPRLARAKLELHRRAPPVSGSNNCWPNCTTSPSVSSRRPKDRLAGPRPPGDCARHFTDRGRPRALISQIGTSAGVTQRCPLPWRRFWSTDQGDNSSPAGPSWHLEDDANLATDGLVEPPLWQALTRAIASVPRPCPL